MPQGGAEAVGSDHRNRSRAIEFALGAHIGSARCPNAKRQRRIFHGQHGRISALDRWLPPTRWRSTCVRCLER